MQEEVQTFGVPSDCRTLGKVLPELLASVKPDLVLYDAGVDPHQNDALGRLSLSSDGLFRRDMQVTASTFASPLHFQLFSHAA